MKSINKYICSALLATAMMMPTAVVAAASPQEVQVRVYDRDHKDYHNWDDREDRAYRHYLQEQHKAYRDIRKQNRREQRAYWKWRHDHKDHD